MLLFLSSNMFSFFSVWPGTWQYPGRGCRFSSLLKSLVTGVKSMQPQRETQTDNLADIMQILQLGYRSGTLTAERGEGQAMEEGYLVFVNGKVVDARAGHYIGIAAFNYLKTWRSCRFSLSESTTEPLAPTPPHQMYGSGNASPGNVWRDRTTTPLPPSGATNFTGSGARYPIRLPAGELALQSSDSARLQRTHRRLLLLINGQRRLDELARLMARDPDEVRVLLNDLEQTGFIRQ